MRRAPWQQEKWQKKRKIAVRHEKGAKRFLKSGKSRFDSRFPVSERRLIIVHRHTRGFLQSFFTSLVSVTVMKVSDAFFWLTLIAPVGLLIHKSCCCYCGRQRVLRRKGYRCLADWLGCSLVEGLAQGDGAVLRRVVVIDVEVALASELEVQVAVLGHRVEHVVKETQAGVHLVDHRR